MPLRPGTPAESTALPWSAFDASPDLVIVVDAEGTVLFMNPVAERVCDPDASPLPWNIEVIDDDDPTHDRYPLVRALNERAPIATEVVTMVHGEPSLWDVRAAPIFDGDELTGAISVGRDITGLLGRGAEAAEQAAFLRTMLRSSGEAILAVGPDFSLRYSNASAREMFALLSEDETLPHEPRDILDVDGRPPTPETLPLERALGGEKNVQTTLRLGSPLDPVVAEGVANPIFDAQGRVIGAVGVYRDVTEEYATRTRMRIEQTFVQQMLDGLEEGIASHNVLTGEDFRNAAAMRMGIPLPAGDEPLPFTLLDGSPVPEDLIFRAMAGEEEPPFEMMDPTTGKVLLARVKGISSEDGVLGAVFTTSDITEQRGASEQLRIQSAAMEATITAMFITDADGTIEWVNRAFSEISGFSADEAIGANPRILKSGHQGPAHYSELWETILRGEPWSGRVINRRKTGEHYVVDQWVTPMRDATGAISHFVAVHDDVTSQVAAEEQILHMATHDALTDLPNRRLFLELLEAAIARAERRGGEVGALMMDLDHFKDVNDSLGHQAGDDLLRSVAARLQDRVRASDTVARLGGDEFAVLVDEASIEGVAKVAADIIDALAKPFEIMSHTVRTGTTVGVAMLEPGLSADDLLARADMALYTAKDRQRGTMEVYATSMSEETERRRQLSEDLREAIDEGALELGFQPVYDLATGRITSVETLVRWPRADGSVLMPDDFLPAASEAGLLPHLGTRVLRAIAGAIADWDARGVEVPPVSFNVSVDELRNRRWAQMLSSVLEEFDIAPDRLIVEISEDVVNRAAEDNLRALRSLQEQGLGLTLDDFGTGLSSLLHFKRLRVNRIKLPRVFIADILTDISSGALVRASALLAHSVRARLVAKGVETIAQLDEVRRLGCQEVQGFLTNEALDADALEALLAERHPLLRPR